MADTVIGVPVVPLAGTDSQFGVLVAEAVNGICEPLDAVTVRLCVLSALEFTDVKVDKGVACIVNAGGVTVRLTLTVCGVAELAV